MDSDVALALQQDHERLDDMLKAAAVTIREHQWKEAVDLLTHFPHGIVNGHIEAEETMPWGARNESLLENPRFANIDLCDDAWINHYDVQCTRCSD